MRKVFIAVLAVLLLAGCDPNPAPGTEADTTLTRAVLGSGSYYVEGGAGSRAIAGGSLKYVSGDALGTVTFIDADGNPASVAVSNALTLSGGGLVIEATYLAVTSAYIVPTSGNLIECVPAPDGWDYARDDGTYLYYIADSGLYRAPLATGVGVLLSGTDSLASGGWIKPSHGGVLYVAPSSATQTLYRLPGDGDPVTTNLQFPSVVSNLCLEGIGGEIYRVRFSGASVYLSAFTAWGTDGGYSGAAEELLCTLPVSTVQSERLSSPKLTHELTIGYAGSGDQGGYLRIVATSTGLSYSVTTAPAGLAGVSFITWDASLDATEGQAAYHAYYDTADLTLWHVWNATLAAVAARGLPSPTSGAEILTDRNVAALTPVGGRLFYQRNTGAGVETMVYDGTSSTVYAPGAVTIQAVK